MSYFTFRCKVAFIPKKIEFDPANYQDESKLLFPPAPWWKFWVREILTVQNRRRLTYLRDEDARTKTEFREVPKWVFDDADVRQMTPRTVEWATQVLQVHPDVVAVAISLPVTFRHSASEKHKDFISVHEYSIKLDNDGIARILPHWNEAKAVEKLIHKE